MRKSYYHQLPLAPLGPDAIRELLVDLLGTDPSTDGLAEAIHARTAGQSLLHRGSGPVAHRVRQARRHARATIGWSRRSTSSRCRAPCSALLAARIDRLPEREKHVLQTAAVIGQEFRRADSGGRRRRTDARSCARRCRALKGAEFIYEQSLYPVAEYALQAPADAGGGARLAAAGAAAPHARGRRARHRGGARRQARRAGRPARPSLGRGGSER